MHMSFVFPRGGGVEGPIHRIDQNVCPESGDVVSFAVVIGVGLLSVPGLPVPPHGGPWEEDWWGYRFPLPTMVWEN